MIPLVVELFQDIDFKGEKSVVLENTPNLDELAANDTSSVKIWRGPDYDAWKAAHGGEEPTVAFFEDADGRGDRLVLMEGQYRALGPIYNFENKASSVYFDTGIKSEFPSVNPPGPITIFAVVTLFTDKNFTGKRTTVIEDIANFRTELGSEFNDKVESLIVKGAPGSTFGVALFFKNAGYEVLESIFIDEAIPNVTPNGWSSMMVGSGAAMLSRYGQIAAQYPEALLIK